LVKYRLEETPEKLARRSMICFCSCVMWALIATVLLLRGPAIYSSCGLNKCGNRHLKNSYHPFGIPLFFHAETEARLILQIFETLVVPPSKSITRIASIDSIDSITGSILDKTKTPCQLILTSCML
jgi:hypothetical protein